MDVPGPVSPPRVGPGEDRRPGWRDRFAGAYRRARATPGLGLALRIFVILLGLAITVLGLFLVPLPGPGWAIVFLGLAITSVEYPPARHLLVFLREKVRAWARWVARQPVWVRVGISAALMAFVLGVSYLTWTYGSVLLR